MKQSAFSSSSSRLSWVDVYRGLAIILIVVGHTWTPIVEYIYLFHVPAFFFISGFTSQFPKYEPAVFLWKRFQSLIVPFFTFNLVFIALHLVLKKLGVASLFYTNGIQQAFSSFGAFNGLISFSQTEEIGGATWFLPVLFSSHVMAYWLVRKKFTEKLDTFVLISASLLLGARFFFARKWYLAYNLDLALFATFFVLLGYKLAPVFEKLSPRIRALVAVLGGLVIVLLGRITNIALDFPSRTFGSLPLVLLSSMAGIVMLYAISKSLTRISWLEKPLAYLGKNSLWILMFHFLGFKVFHLLAGLTGILPLGLTQRLVPEPGNSYWILLSIWGVVFSIGALWSWKVFVAILKRMKPAFTRGLSALQSRPEVWQATALSVLTALHHSWVLSRDNFFYADDFGYLWLSQVKTWSGFVSFIPQQMYNDRPFGQFFIHALITLFDFHYRYIHVALLGVHVLNALLLFWLLKRLSRLWKLRYSLFPFLAALLFAAWPKSTFAVQWLSASFDLVGATLLLAGLHAVISLITTRSKTAIVAAIASFVLMIRTKEVLLFMPVLATTLVLLQENRRTLFEKIRSSRPLFATLTGLVILMTLYGLRLVFLALASRFMGFEGASPYAVSLSPLTLALNAFRYFVLYFNIFDTQQVFSTLSLRWLIIFAVMGLGMLAAGIFSRHRRYVLFFLFAAILMLVPVLPLKNMAHKLYLYIPSLFLASALILLAHDFLERLKVRESRLALMMIGLLFWFSFQWGPFRAERGWWQAVGLENRRTYLQLEALNPQLNVQEALIVDAPPTSIYTFGPGDIVRYHFKKAGITTRLISVRELPEATPSSTIVLPGRN